MKKKLTIGSLKGNSLQGSMPGPSDARVQQPSETLIKSDTNRVALSSTLYVVQNDNIHSILPEKGRSLLDVALEQGSELDYKCKKGTCGRCKVQILKGEQLLTQANEQEHEKLGEQISAGMRLACQTIIQPY